MKFMVIVQGCESDAPPSQEFLAAMVKFNQELGEAGVLESLEGLEPSSEGIRVRFEGANRTVTDGPFSETKELIGGFWLWNCKSKQEAIEWLKRAPFDGGKQVEIRPVREGFREMLGVASVEEQLAAQA